MHGRDLILELRIADDDPLVPERVLAPLELGAAVGRDRVQQLLDVALRALELGGREGFEADRPGAGRPEVQLRLQRHGCGRQREQPLGRRLSQLLPAEEDVAKTHQWPGLPSLLAIEARCARRRSRGG